VSPREIAEEAHEEMWAGAHAETSDLRSATPTPRQIHALARMLCERAGEPWPETNVDASRLIERLASHTDGD
jgi:hypothetical protein